MIKNPRRKVVKFTERPNDYEGSKHLFPVVCEATLECGHTHNLGVASYRPQRMACDECGKITYDHAMALEHGIPPLSQ